MSGYSGYSKSNNAIAAEAEGRFPLTRATQIVARATGLTLAAARAILEKQGPLEWHHVSKQYNRVNFYDPRRAIGFHVARSAVASLEAAGYSARITAALREGGDDLAARTAALEALLPTLVAETGIAAETIQSCYWATWEDFAAQD